MRPHHDYVLVGRRAALSRDFETMLDDLTLGACTGSTGNHREHRRWAAVNRIE